MKSVSAISVLLIVTLGMTMIPSASADQFCPKPDAADQAVCAVEQTVNGQPLITFAAGQAVWADGQAVWLVGVVGGEACVILAHSLPTSCDNLVTAAQRAITLPAQTFSF